MVEYKVHVVKKADSSYLVGHYHKAFSIPAADFASVVNILYGYSRNGLDIFVEEPTLRGLSREERDAVRHIRDLVLEARVK
jgi:hypothetical protein